MLFAFLLFLFELFLLLQSMLGFFLGFLFRFVLVAHVILLDREYVTPGCNVDRLSSELLAGPPFHIIERNFLAGYYLDDVKLLQSGFAIPTTAGIPHCAPVVRLACRAPPLVLGLAPGFRPRSPARPAGAL